MQVLEKSKKKKQLKNEQPVRYKQVLFATVTQLWLER